MGDEYDGAEEQITESLTENPSTRTTESLGNSNSLSQSQLYKALEVVERDSLAIAQSYTSLFASLRLALSEATNASVDHIQCFNDAAGKLQESAIEAAIRGNRFIHSCMRLNEEMKDIDDLASRLKVLRRNVDALDSAVNRLL